MSVKMQMFTNLERKTQDKRTPEERKSDFREIYQKWQEPEAKGQGSRCEQCGVPYCQLGCPLHNNIPDWIMFACSGRMEEAWQLLSQTNCMPEITSRICPQDRLCESRCTLAQSGHGAVTIGCMEKYIADFAFSKSWVKPPLPTAENNCKIAIIGSGPAGLAAAHMLREKGYGVTVFERKNYAGGLLAFGVPGFKLEKDVVARRVDLLKAAGVEFKLGVAVGEDIPFAKIVGEFSAVLIATGAHAARKLSGEGKNLKGVVSALTFLEVANGLAQKTDVTDVAGKKVLVIGGGDTAMDCVRSSLRLGAASVKCLYRRNQENMPGSKKEVENAIEEGGEFIWLVAPKAVLGEGSVKAVKLVKMKLGEADGSGRRSPVEIAGSEYEEPADIVIEALGFEPEDLPLMFDARLKTNRDGSLKTDPQTGETSLAGVFAAGDASRGAALAVWGIRDGMVAAQAIDAYVMRKKQQEL